jgi:putative membrane protein
MQPSAPQSTEPFDPSFITRPDPALLKYYFICAAFTVIGFPFVILPLVFKFQTLKYRFDDKGVSMSWGLLFHREIYLTYRRIQDIHVTRNLVHRWLGLAAVSVQTASGSAGAEMTIEGIRNPEALRDYLYAQMRGARGEDAGDDATPDDAASLTAGAPNANAADEALLLLREIREELKSLRREGGTGRS